MTRTKTITLYKYDELSDKAKDKAIEWYASAGYYDEWWLNTYEDAKNVGIKITEFDIDRGNYIKGEFTQSANLVAMDIVKDHGVDCETHKTASSYLSEREKALEQAERDEETGEFTDEYTLDKELDALDAEFKKAILEDYLSMLRREYEFQISREVIEENIIANEYEFNENGEIE